MLDGVISAAERDEFAYLEMMAHLPLNCHPKPEKVSSLFFLEIYVHIYQFFQGLKEATGGIEM